jgi:putative nucleotidyltransferase with HDIG domain
MSKDTQAQNTLDLTPYAGRWVALVRGRIAGVGRTAKEARRAAQAARPKEKPELRFVTLNAWQDHPLLERLWAFVKASGADVLLVGGAVRDGLLGRPLHDLDFVVNGEATSLAVAASRHLRGALVPLDPARDIARVVVHHDGCRYDVDFARRHGPDWESDLRARDFTVNAIAVDAEGSYLDPLGGRQDLAGRRLRATHQGAFRDDPLRTLRAVRLLAELDFVIVPQTAAWIRHDAALLHLAAPERIRDEFVRILDAPYPARHLALVDDLGLLIRVYPEAEGMQGTVQSPPHQWDVWNHTRMAVAAVEALLRWISEPKMRPPDIRAPGWIWGDLEKRLGALRPDLATHFAAVVSDVRDRRFLLKLATLLHDVGKPFTQSVGDDARIHFYDHENVGADLAAERMRALRFSAAEVKRVHTIIMHHMRPGHLAHTKGPTRRAIYRYFRATEDAGVDIAILSLADLLARSGPALESRDWLRRLQVVTTLLSNYFEHSSSVAPPPLVNGHDLMGALGISAGPRIGELLEAIREAQATGQIRSRRQALALAETLRRKWEDEADTG